MIDVIERTPGLAARAAMTAAIHARRAEHRAYVNERSRGWVPYGSTYTAAHHG